MLLKQRLEYEVKLRETMLGSEFVKIRSNFTESLKSTARIYGQKLAVLVLLRLLRKKFKSK